MSHNSKVLIWGAGKLYSELKEELSDINVIYIVDNNTLLQGKQIDNIKIISCEKLKEIVFDQILILVKNENMIQEIKSQLKDLSIPEEEIYIYKEILDVKKRFPKVITQKEEIEMSEWLGQNLSYKKALVIIPFFSYSGVPISSMNMCLALKDMGYNVILASQDVESDGIIKELKKFKIDYLRNISKYWESKWIADSVSKFDFIVVSSLIQQDFVSVCSTLKAKFLWWIHETEEICYRKVMPNFNNIYIYGVGNRVIRIFNNHYKDIEIKKLNYWIPESKKDSKNNNNIFTFGIIGTICKRKAQDLVLYAIKRMPLRYRNGFRCVIIGKPINKDEYWNENNVLLDEVPEIQYLGELVQSEVDEMYREIDVLICPSRDDPMPIVVTQAMMNEKFCIISENVGQEEYIINGENGFVFSNEDIEELKEYMIWTLENKDRINKNLKISREVYEKEFSSNVMKINITKIMEEMIV